MEERGRKEVREGGEREREREEEAREGGSMYQMVCRTPVSEWEKERKGNGRERGWRRKGKREEREIRSRKGTKGEG